jgi:iron complex outermembrane receptor protein
MLRLLLLPALLFIAPISLLAQQPARCVFTGSIHLESNGSPISNAQLFVSDYAPTRGKMDVNWPSSFTDAEGNFSMDLKGQANFLRIIRTQGDTIDIGVRGFQCNTHQDIIVGYVTKPAETKTYVIGEMPYVLPGVTLQAFSSRSTLNRIPASVGYIDKQLLESTDQSSLQPALNTIAGVMMESRGYGGSHRLNIRGSSLRSPFAVRNVKMYLDGIPLTGADGQTPLELIDATDLESIEVIKGPAGSMYGSGNGGVLLLKSARINSGEVQIQTGFQAASFGGYRSNTSAAAGFKTSQLRISHNWQEYSGYREQEFNRKQQVSISLKQRLSETQDLTFWGTYYKGNWGLPGALNQTQADTFPQQAVPFSVLNNASLLRERYVGAISQTGKWGKHVDHFITLNYHHANKKNPYGTSPFNSGYKNENSQSLSGRALLNFKEKWNNLNVKASIGAEWQTETYSILEQKIEQGSPKDFKYFYDIGYGQSMVFGQTELNWKDILFLTGGISIGNNEQFVRGRNANDFQFDTTTTWGKTILPRFAFSIQPVQGLFLYRSFSSGAANPTVFEMIDQENNTYNLSLTSERGKLHELGIKHHIANTHIEYSITAYQFEITDAILPYSIETADGDNVQRFHNAGSTLQQGMEWSFKYKYLQENNGLNFMLWNNGTCNKHHFQKYVVDETILNGKNIPGIPLTQMNTGIQLEYKQFNVSIIDYWMDRMPLENSNATWTPSYHLLNIMASYKRTLLKHLECSVHAGINNLLDSSYSSFLNLNAVNAKYYNPSAPRNFFCGFSLNYTLSPGDGSHTTP